MDKILKIGVLGHTGRVGRLIVDALQFGEDWPGMSFAGGVSKADRSDPLFARADVLIDFTAPEAAVEHARLAAQHGKPLVIGTTGLDAAQDEVLKKAAKETAILQAANMSLGVNLLMALVETTAARLGTAWDIEIAETHHRNKADAPSGTALALGKAAAAGRKGGDFVTDRAGKRTESSIGFAVQRGGDVVGEHMVTFFGAGERIMLGHTATDRALFARGALTAARWIAGKPAGFYTMRDVLGL